MKIKDLNLMKSKLRLTYKEKKNEINEDIDKELENISKNKREDNRRFIKNNRKWFLILDIVMILMIFMNLGALLITHAMVMKTTPDQIVTKLNPITNQVEEFIIKGNQPPILQEANPVAAKYLGIKEHPDSLKVMFSVVRFITYWSFLIFMYIFWRKRIRKEWQLEILTFYVLFYVVAMGTDFISNLGFWIGKLIY